MKYAITMVNTHFDEKIQAKIDGKTKPLGALGKIEVIAKKIATIQGMVTNQIDSLAINQPTLIVFAGDHGVASEGVSIAPSEVTGQMVANFATGGAAINVFCRQLGWQLSVVDAGILHEPPAQLKVINQRLGSITEPLHQAPAMTLATVEYGFVMARDLVKNIKQKGSNLVAFGEMGIGNTTSASAIMAAIMKLSPAETVGKGTGVSDEIITKKQQVVAQALKLHRNSLNDPWQLLACLGGFEIVQITGAMLAAAEQSMHILIDGFICTAAAMVAVLINPAVKDYMIFAHCSGEQGHHKMLKWLGVEPLLNLGLRLGEGTGAALALPLIQASVAFYNDMASFEQAEVTKVVQRQHLFTSLKGHITMQSFYQQIKPQLMLLLLAISFFTRIPVRLPADITAEQLNKASRYFAVVGFLVGLICSLIYAVSVEHLPKSIAVLIAMAASLIITGSFHEDGWADVWDGFGGGWSIEQKLNIMKDSRLGTYGAAALFLILLLKYQSLIALTSPVIALIIANTLSRVVATSLIFDMSYVALDATSKVKPLAQHLSTNSLLILLLTGLLVSICFLPVGECILLFVILFIFRALLVFWFTRQLGGYTGDCLGAAQQSSEIVVYLSLLIFGYGESVLSVSSGVIN